MRWKFQSSLQTTDRPDGGYHRRGEELGGSLTRRAKGIPQRQHQRGDVRRRGPRFGDYARSFTGGETTQKPPRSARLSDEVVEHHRPAPSGTRVRATLVRHVRLHLNGKEGCHHHSHPLHRRLIFAWRGHRAARDAQEEADENIQDDVHGNRVTRPRHARHSRPREGHFDHEPRGLHQIHAREVRHERVQASEYTRLQTKAITGAARGKASG